MFDAVSFSEPVVDNQIKTSAVGFLDNVSSDADSNKTVLSAADKAQGTGSDVNTAGVVAFDAFNALMQAQTQQACVHPFLDIESKTLKTLSTANALLHCADKILDKSEAYPQNIDACIVLFSDFSLKGLADQLNAFVAFMPVPDLVATANIAYLYGKKYQSDFAIPASKLWPFLQQRDLSQTAFDNKQKVLSPALLMAESITQGNADAVDELSATIEKRKQKAQQHKSNINDLSTPQSVGEMAFFNNLSPIQIGQSLQSASQTIDNKPYTATWLVSANVGDIDYLKEVLGNAS